MKFLKLFPVLIVCAMLMSCAAVPISPDVSKNMINSKVAVAYVQLEKKIKYEEVLYRVFWLENREQNVSFDGLWDIDKDLSTYMAPKISAIGLHPTSIYNVAKEEHIADLHKLLKYTHPDFNNGSRKALKLSESLRQSLHRNNIGYLITIYSDYIYIQTQTGVKLGSARTQLNVMDVNSNEEKYNDIFYMGDFLKVEKTVREIENNNLAGLKREMKNWLDTAISSQMPKKLGLSQQN